MKNKKPTGREIERLSLFRDERRIRRDKQIRQLYNFFCKLSSWIVSTFWIITKVFMVFIISICAGKGSIDFIIWINGGLVGITYATYVSYMVAALVGHVLMNYYFGSKK